MQNKLPERLKKLRAATELSQAKLAIKLGIPQQTYDRWEQGKNQPDADMLIQLAAYFEVTVDYLIGYSNEMYSGERMPQIPRQPASKEYIPPQPQMHYVHVPMRGGKDKGIYVTDEEFNEMEEILHQAGEKHYRDDQKKKK